MINRERPRPIILEFIDAVLGRILEAHEKIPIITADKNRHEAGYAGEKRLDTYLEYFPEPSYNILNDLRLSTGPFFFQMDTLLINHKKILILDAKNMAGKLYFDKRFGQLIQNDEIGYEDPILQAEMHVRELKRWLANHKFPDLPIEYLILMSNQKCILDSNNIKVIDKVCRGRQLIQRIDELTEKYSIRDDMLPPDQYRKLIRLLIKKHTDPVYNLEKRYNISRCECRTGVHCPICRFLGMVYERGKWLCKNCGCKSRNAHLGALRDYFLLYGPFITNQQFREFVHAPTMNIAYKMIRALKLEGSGPKKKMIYKLSWEELVCPDIEKKQKHE